MDYTKAIDLFKKDRKVSLEYLSFASEIPLKTIQAIESGELKPDKEQQLILSSFLSEYLVKG